MTVVLSSLSPLSGSPIDSIKQEPTSTETMLPPTMTVPSSTGPPPPSAKSAGKPKSRKRVNTAEKRHQHNAIERQRRETLNSKFLSLARLLPSLAESRRPSKSAIVNGSIAHLNYQRDQRLLAAKLLRRLAADHDALLAEANEWRKASGYAPKEVASAWIDDMEEVCGVEKETFGNFASFDEGDGDNDDDDMMGPDPALEAANHVAANFSHGLITPRHSTELDAMTHTQAMFGTAQPMSMPQQHPDHKRAPTVNVNGFNWSNGLGFAAGAGPSAPSAASLSASMTSTSSTLPFGAFMSDSIDVSSSGSPSNSTQGGHVLTPPTLADHFLYDHTPSPGSASSVAAHSDAAAAAADKATPVAAGAWSDNIFMLQQLQQAQLRQQQQQQQASLAAAAARVHAYSASGNVALAASMFNAMFPSGQSPTALAHMQQSMAAAASPPDAFTQNLLASVFPQQGVSTEQIDAWRKLALSGMSHQQQQPQQHQQQQQPAGMRALGRSQTVPGLMSSGGMWDTRPEGF